MSAGLLLTLHSLECRQHRPATLEELAAHAGIPAEFSYHLAEPLRRELASGHVADVDGCFELTAAGRLVLAHESPGAAA